LAFFLRAFFLEAFFLGPEGTGLGIDERLGALTGAGGFHGSFSGKWCTEKQIPGLCTCGRGSFFRFICTTFPQVNLTFTNASQYMNPQNKFLNDTFWGSVAIMQRVTSIMKV